MNSTNMNIQNRPTGNSRTNRRSGPNKGSKTTQALEDLSKENVAPHRLPSTQTSCPTTRPAPAHAGKPKPSHATTTLAQRHVPHQQRNRILFLNNWFLMETFVPVIEYAVERPAFFPLQNVADIAGKLRSTQDFLASMIDDCAGSIEHMPYWDVEAELNTLCAAPRCIFDMISGDVAGNVRGQYMERKNLQLLLAVSLEVCQYQKDESAKCGDTALGARAFAVYDELLLAFSHALDQVPSGSMVPHLKIGGEEAKSIFEGYKVWMKRASASSVLVRGVENIMQMQGAVFRPLGDKVLAALAASVPAPAAATPEMIEPAKCVEVEEKQDTCSTSVNLDNGEPAGEVAAAVAEQEVEESPSESEQQQQCEAEEVAVVVSGEVDIVRESLLLRAGKAVVKMVSKAAAVVKSAWGAVCRFICRRG